MVVTKKEDKEFLTVLKEVVSGGLDIPSLIEELETGIVHKEDNTYTYNERWDFEYHANSDVVLASEDFMKVVTAATYAVGEEWGGLIFGKVIRFKNNCNVYICEKVAIMAQVRGSADFEIKDEHYQDWARTPEFIEFLGADFARIGWVHSHVNMGCFWSGTDTNTMKQLVEEETNDHIVSLVVSKRADTTLDVKWLTSNRGVHNGIQFRVPEATTKELPSWKIHYEAGELPSWGSWDEDYQAHWKTRMTELTVIRGAVTQQSAYGSSAVGAWSDARAQASGKKVHLDIPAFILQVADHDPKVRTFLLTQKKWKMKKVVPAIAEDKLIKIMDFFLKTSNRVQQYLIVFTNFEELAKSFCNNLLNRVNKEPALKETIVGRYGAAWVQLFRSTLVAKTYSISSSGATTYQRPPKAPDWDDIFFGIDTQHQKGIVNALLKVEGVIFKEVIKKLVDSLEWRVRNEEGKWVDAFVTIWMSMNEYRTKYKRDSTVKEITTGIEALLDEAFKSYRAKNEKAKNALQTVVNCLPDELVFAFMQDFVAEVDTQEELDQLYIDGKISVRSKMFACEICKNWCPTLKEAESCKKTCKKIELKKSKGLGKATTIKHPSEETTTPKGSKDTTRQTTLAPHAIPQTATTSTGKGGMDSNPLLYGGVHICGITPNYWRAPNVCKQCGMEYSDEVLAKHCEVQCLNELDGKIEDILSLQGYVICSECGACFTDMLEFETHMDSSPDCAMLGMTLHVNLRLYCIQTDDVAGRKGAADFSINFEEFTNLILIPMNDITSGKVPGLHPELLKWLADLLAKQKSLWYCGKCGLTYKDFADPLDAVYKRFYHEGICNGREGNVPVEFVEGTIPIKYQLLTYFCGLCGFTKGFFHEEDLMRHLHVNHSVDLKSAILNITFGNTEEVKDQYPEWQKKKYEIDCALNICRYCKVEFASKSKMEENVIECFEHEFKCGKRFPRTFTTIDKEGTLHDLLKDPDAPDADIVIISTPDDEVPEDCVKDRFDCDCSSCEEKKIMDELDDLTDSVKTDAIADVKDEIVDSVEEKEDES